MTTRTDLHGGVSLIHGDCLAVLPTLDAVSVDAIVTDPPAGIAFMGKAWDSDKGGKRQWIAWMQGVAAECLRLAKPGAHALVWALPRTSHWTADAWEEAGWTVRDRVSHLFGTGYPKSHNIGGGRGTALKPAMEDWWLLRKPLSEQTVAANVTRHGTGSINIDGCRVGGGVLRSTGNGRRERVDGYGMQGGVIGGSSLGRWPANLTHDGSDAVLEAFAEFGERTTGKPSVGTADTTGKVYGKFANRSVVGGGDSGSAARFFYCAKAGADDRLGSQHPTVKNVELMRWLCRLITPPGGLILDPFAGSGTTGNAALREGFRSLLIEQDAESCADIKRRLAHICGDDTPLFAGPPALAAQLGLFGDAA